MIVGAGPGMCPNPARASDRQTKGFDHVCPVHGGERETAAAGNSVNTCVVLAAAAFAVLAFAANTAASPLYRATVTAATSDDRAGLITAIYIVSYLATGIPAVLAGVATSSYGLHKTALVYSVAVAVLAAAAVGSLLTRQMASGRAQRGTRHADPPPGPGTVPPCPPIRPPPGEARA